MHRITYEWITDEGVVTVKKVWDVHPEGDVNFTENCPVKHTRPLGSDIPDGSERGPTTLQISATLDPHTHWAPYQKEQA